MIPKIRPLPYRQIRGALQMQPMSLLEEPETPISGPAPGPSLWGRVADRLMPAGAAGELLDPADIRQARFKGLMDFGTAMLGASGPSVGAPAPSLGQALGAGVQAGMGGYQNALKGAVEMRGFANEQKQQEAMLARRAAIQAKYPPAANETPDQTRQRMTMILDELVRAGDTKMATALSQYLMGTEPSAPRAVAPQEIDIGNEVILRDPVTGKEVARYPKGATPRDPSRDNGPDAQRLFLREQGIRDDFLKDTDKLRTMYNTVGSAVNELPNALRGDGAAQTNILYAFVTAMDPNSAVREGELALVRAASSLRAQAQQLIDKYVQSGESAAVPPQMLQQMADLMNRKLQFTETTLQEKTAYWSQQAQRAGIPNAPGLFPTIRRQAQRAAGSPGSNPMYDR